MRRSPRLLVVALSAALGCRSASTVPVTDAAMVFEGRADAGAVMDTIDEKATISLVERARWSLRTRPNVRLDFWSDISLLDVESADLVATSVEQRTFAAALRTLMGGDPAAAAVAFEVLRSSAKDSVVRSRSRIGLTMALSYHSDWSALARIESQNDSTDYGTDRLALAAGVERWARALSMMPTPTFVIPEQTVTLPMRRSPFGTPVITVSINGHPHDFWLDTGASMTLLSADVAIDAGLKLAARDTLALGVVAGHIEARAVYIDSLAIGPVVVRGLGAAIVNPEALRFDERLASGPARPLARPIAGMIGTDVLRHLDIVLDAGAETMTIRRPRRVAVPTRNLFWIGYPVVRLVTRDGRPLLFGLDTGAEATYVTSTLLDKLPRTRVAARRTTLSGIGSDKKQAGWVARDVPLSDGNYAILLRNVPVLPAQRWTFVDFDGVIGSDVALATRMHLDFTNGVFDIRGSNGPAKRTPGALDGVKVF
ncbi:MAG: retropepsin-like aspartic protease [bacterium]